MKITPTHVPAIPKPPATLSPELRRYLESITEALEIRLGRRGDPVDRAITLRELISSGLASELAATPFNPNLINSGNIGLGPGYVNLDVPPPVIGFDAAGAYSQVNIFWTYPYYANHNQTEIWSHTTDSLGDATLAAVSTGRSVVDPIGGGETRYYWARHVSNSDVKGPFNSSSGTLAVTATNPQAILAELEGAISVTELADSLAAPISNLPQNTEQALLDEALARSTAITASADALQTEIDGLVGIAYDSSVTYSTNDQVSYSGNLYKASQSTTGNLPTNTTYWIFVGEFTSLGAAVGSAVANIIELNTVTADSDSAAARALSGLQVTVNDPDTGLAVTRSTLVNDYYTKTDADSAITSAVTGLVSNTTLADYTTTAGLEENYYTKTDADGAITSAVTGLVSNTTLANYTTTAGLLETYYTKTDADGAIASAVTGLVSNTTLANYTTTAGLVENYYTKTNADGAIASAVNTLSSGYENPDGSAGTVSLQTAMTTQADVNGALKSQYSVKIDNKGHVSGFGLNSVAVNGVPESAFVIRADKFAIVDPASTANGSTNTPSADVIPFGVTNGVVYIKSAAIEDGTITNAKIGTIDADKITTGFIRSDRIEAGSIDASKITLVGVGTLIDLKSSATGGRMEILGNSIVVYDSTGALRVKLGAL